MIAQRSGTMGMPLSLWPFGGRDPFESMMADMHRMRSDPNAEVFSSSSVMTYSSTGDGSRPKIYQATTSTRRAPGQVCVCVCICVWVWVGVRVCLPFGLLYLFRLRTNLGGATTGMVE